MDKPQTDLLPEADQLASLLPTLMPGAQTKSAADMAIEKILHAIRTHLGMDVAFISEFTGKDRVFRHVDAAGWTPIHPGDSLPLEKGYCQRVVDGRLPRLIPDATALPEAMALPETLAIPIGSHMSVPIRLSDGSLYGTFCCFGFTPDSSLNDRDLHMMSAFADLVAYQLDIQLAGSRERLDKVHRIEAAMRQGGPAIVFQPIYLLNDGSFVGVECLSRFSIKPEAPPDVWFADAADVGLGTALELCAIKKALEAIQVLPRHIYLALNASPETILSNKLDALLVDVDAERVVIELTEHAHVSDYAQLMRSLQPLRSRGVRVSVDDAGAGYASMRHILSVQPDIIKLDISLTRSIDTDPTRYALAAALIEFARQTGSSVLAEGVETASELNSLRTLGASTAQGFYLSRPLPLAEAARCTNKQADHVH